MRHVSKLPYLKYVVLIAIGFATGWHFKTPQTVTVEKEVIVATQVKNKDTVTRRVTETRPDGTVSIIEDKHTQTRTESEDVTSREKKKTESLSQWSMGLYATPQMDKAILDVDRRILGNIFVGGFVLVATEKPLVSPQIGLGVRVEF